MKKVILITAFVSFVSASAALAKTEGNYVGIDILSELCGSTNEKTKEYITHLSQQSLVEMISVNFALGIKIPVIVQDAVKKYMISNNIKKMRSLYLLNYNVSNHISSYISYF